MAAIKESSSIEVLTQELSSLLGTGFPESLAKDDAARIALLGLLQKLTAALETPEDVVNRTVFTVRIPFTQLCDLRTLHTDLGKPSIYMCARVAIDLKLFDLIVGADGPISSAQLAAQTQAEEQLIGEINQMEALDQN